MGYLLFAAFGAADFSLSEQYSIQAAIRESVRAGKQETGRKRIRGRKYLFRGKSNIMIIIRKKDDSCRTGFRIPVRDGQGKDWPAGSERRDVCVPGTSSAGILCWISNGRPGPGRRESTGSGPVM
jgi:hypothetical protein